MEIVIFGGKNDLRLDIWITIFVFSMVDKEISMLDEETLMF